MHHKISRVRGEKTTEADQKPGNAGIMNQAHEGNGKAEEGKSVKSRRKKTGRKEKEQSLKKR